MPDLAGTSFAHSQGHGSAQAKFWLAVAFLLAVGVGLAWLGAGSLRGEKTASGLVFRTVKAGSGPFITDADAVLVDYDLHLADGKLIDSSSQHGGPQVMTPREVIPGVGEALTKMQKGGTYHFVVPPKLGYGETPPPGNPVPPHSNLEFDIHVVDVAPGAAAMAAQAAAQGQAAPQDQAEPPQDQQQQ